MPSSKHKAWLLMAASIVLQLVLLRSAKVLKDDPTGSLVRRDQNEDIHVSLLALPYADWYQGAASTARLIVIAGILGILAFLFSFIGITASDFFCPNLATIANYLGLSESTAGVTFLAFGNGSPDVFSTFAALRGGTFSLAIGELIGAASFIVSIVVGTIALIRPFHVPRQAFLRDVVFFTVAVILLIAVLHDGHLTLLESGSMVALYVAYAVVVIFGNWWTHRKDQSDQLLNDGDINVPATPVHGPVDVAHQPQRLHLPSPTPSVSGSPTLAARRAAAFKDNPDSAVDVPRANFSLLGAIEFRDVINSLKKESESRGGSPNRTPRRTPHGLSDEAGEDYFGASLDVLGHRRSSSVGISKGTHGEHVHGRKRAISHVGPSKSTMSSSLHPPSDSPPRLLIPDTTSSSFSDGNPWADQHGQGSLQQGAKPVRPVVTIPRRSTGPRVPSISITDPSGLPGALPIAQTPALVRDQNESPLRLRWRSKKVLRILFPSLQSFRHKSLVGMFLSVTSVPIILALTLTLPVVDDGASSEGGIALPISDAEPLTDGYFGVDDVEAQREDHFDGPEEHLLGPRIGEELHHLVEQRFSPLHSPLGRIHHSSLQRKRSGHFGEDEDDSDVDERTDKERAESLKEEEALDYHKFLTAVQCVLGPNLCAFIVFRETDYYAWITLVVTLCGLAAGAAVMWFSTDGSSPSWRLVRCFAGFIVSMTWIAAIADEVVSVLQAVGEILGLSDAIIGLTIFAVGNSLADLVANVTVAQFAPAMAYAACFGGPMLNLLLGVGGSGTYHMLSSSHVMPVTLHFSPTLWVSALGLVLVLVATAIVVPLNGYLIDRRWACCLIAAYIILMSINVAVEVKTGRE